MCWSRSGWWFVVFPKIVATVIGSPAVFASGAALCVAVLFVVEAVAQEAPADPQTPEIAPEPDCVEQQPQPVLIRANYIRHRGESRPDRHEADVTHRAAIRYRTEHYGYFEGVGDPEWNEHTPRELSESSEFMGLHVRMNAQVLPALHCVEAEIRRTCTDEPYSPSRLSTLRDRPTPGRETSNHVYGIAIDIDPSDNTCCGCVGEWAEHPLCALETDDLFERMAMPECWVQAFEKYGWYWYGHEDIEDTMHFDYLGVPYPLDSAP